MPANLFRPEVYGKNDTTYGSIILIRPISFFAYTSAISAIVIIIILYAGFGSYRNYKSLEGVITSSKGVIDISAINPGVVWDIQVDEGEHVKKGDPLFLIRTEKKLPSGRVDEKILQQLEYEKDLIESQIDEARKIYSIQFSIMEKKIENSKEELGYLKEKHSIRKKNHQSLSDDVVLYKKSLEKGQITTSQYRDKVHQKQLVEIEMLQDDIEKANLQAAIVEAGKEIQKNKIELSNTINKLSQQHAELKKQIIRNNSESEYLIESPVEGKVSVLLGKLGQHVSTNDLLLNILPSNSVLQAEFYAPSRSVGFSSVNQDVLIRFDAFPYQKYGLHRGLIVSISETILQPKHADKSMNIKEPAYKILVELDKQYVMVGGKKYHLQPGMTLDGRFLGQKMRIIEWVFDPLLSVLNNTST